MSNRLTFSLTSLILIFALAFAVTPVMAQSAPTVTITEDTTGTQTRDAFKVKIAFSAEVTGFAVSDVAISGATSSTAGFTTYANAPTFTPGTGADAGKVWTLTINIPADDTTHSHSAVKVSIPGGAAIADGLGNVAATKTFTDLPPTLSGEITLSLVPTSLNDDANDLDVIDGMLQSQATFSVNFTSDLATAPASLLRSAILINGDRANPGTNVNGVDISDNSDPSFDSTTKVAVVNFTVGPDAIDPVRISLNPNYATAAADLTVPQLPDVTLTLQGDIDTTDKEFAVRLTFTEAVSSFAKEKIVFYQANADGTKSTNPALVTVDTLVGTGRIRVAQCSYPFEELPLYVTVSNTVIDEMTPEDGLKIDAPSEPAPTGPTVAPTGLTATGPTGLSRDIVLSWDALTDPSITPPVTGYKISVYKGDTDTTATTKVGDDISLTGVMTTTYTYRAVQADRGKYFTFKVAGVNSAGTGLFTAASTAVQIPGVVFDADDAISKMLLMCEGDTTTGDGAVLPRAYGAEAGANITYALSPALLPPGFSWDNQDHQTRTIRRTAAAEPIDTKYTWTATAVDGANTYTDTYEFRIHVEAHQLPMKPATPAASKVASADTTDIGKNKVRLTWDAPDDYSAYSTCIPYPKDYVVYVEKWDELTEAFVKLSRNYSSANEGDAHHFKRGSVLAAIGGDDDATPKDYDDVAIEFAVQLQPGIYKFQIKAHNISKLNENKGVGLSEISDYATWAVLDGEEHIVVANPPAAPIDLRAAIHSGDDVTVNWLKVPDANDGGAPINDDADSTDPNVAAARAKFYGSFAGDFGGYVVYQVNQATFEVTRYPSEGTLNVKTVEDDDAIDGMTDIFYQHPTIQILDLEPGEYVFRVTAMNIAGESLRSLSTPHAHVRIVEPPTDPDNRAPDFGDATIASITATKDQPIAGRFLPEAKDADGDALTYSILDAAGNATATPGGLKFDSTTRALTGTPGAAMGETAYTYKVADGNGGSDTIGFFITVNATAPAPPGVHLTATHANGVTTILGTLNANSFGTVGADALPNIQRFFAEGGSISLLSSKTGAVAKDVVISEIMWGLDLNQGTSNQDNQQFIELYNTTNAAISLSMVTIDFDDAKAIPTVPSGQTLLDQVSNVSGVGWVLTDVDAPGQSGNIPTATNAGSKNLVSMYRNINYKTVEKSDHDADAKKNRDAQLKGIPDGNSLGDWKNADPAKGNWRPSNIVDTYGLNLIGSPRAKHFVAYKPLTASAVDRSMIIINEIGNHSDDRLDWVELRNVSTGEVNLKKWELSQVTGSSADKKDTQLVSFPDNDNHKIPAGGILLVVNSDPYRDTSHPIAAGSRINGGGEKTGSTARYYVDGGLKLANSGDTLLILRNANDKEGKAEAFKDVVGTLSITDDTAGFRTNMWPLAAAKAAHGNVIDGDKDNKEDDFRSGRVYKRNDASGGTDEKDLAIVGYTGVGYKRSAANNGQNGGTPGYANDAVKVNVSDLASDETVTISEIMYAKGRNLPQWIELYNSSMTKAVNLSEWKLRIDNLRSDDTIDIRSPSVTTNNLGNVTIQPNQTVLIVSGKTRRDSRSAQAGVDFPDTRVVDLWGQKDRIEVATNNAVTGLKNNNLSYKLLSETAFTLTLMDKGGAIVDTFSNLDTDRETVLWELPMAESDEGRSSIIRSYPKESRPNVEADGMMENAWILASMTNLAEVPYDDTYYGSPTDIGTPGFRGGGPLPVSLSKFRPERLDDGSIVVRWITESELNNAGFNILRSEKRDGEFKQINTKLIKGQGTTSERTPYEWKDSTAKPNVVYYYQIQDVSLDGKVQTLRQSRLKGNVTAAGKLTTTWGELKALQ